MKGKNFGPAMRLEPDDLRREMMCRGWAMSAVGWVVYAILYLFGNRPSNFEGICPYFTIGRGWGGVSLGWFFICSDDAPDSTKCHEVGHLIQNAAVGGLTMLGYSIGSAIRYWWRRTTKDSTPYDEWYFEGDATRIGREYVERIRSEMDGEE